MAPGSARKRGYLGAAVDWPSDPSEALSHSVPQDPHLKRDCEDTGDRAGLQECA